MPDYSSYFVPVEPMELEFFDSETHKPIGRLKIKPSTVQWKPKGKQYYWSVSIEDLGKWIFENGNRVTK